MSEGNCKNILNLQPKCNPSVNIYKEKIGTLHHDNLIHRNYPDQHPISAITDLTETLSGIGGNIGDLENLTTENKDSLVSAINEVDSHADVNASNIGVLSSLTTTAKDNLVSAINEVDSHADTNATNLSNHIADKNNPHEVTKAQVGLGNCDNTSDLDKPISTATQVAITAEENRAKGVEGSLSNLTTTDKTNLVSAINELDSDKQDNLSAGTGIDITENVISVTDPTLINNGTGTNALAVGKSSQATGEGGVSVGQDARANSTYATAVGQGTRATNTNTVALGRGAKATQQRAIAIGSGAEANAQDAIAIKGINNTANTFQVYTYQMLDMSNGLIPNARINIDSTPTENSTNTVSSGGVYSAVDGLQSQITTNAGDIDTIEGKIPSAASSSNQLADKNFVNSSISTNTANFIGTFNSVADLEAYSGTLTNNDYAFVIVTDSLGNTAYDRYKYTTATTPASWRFEYELNNSSFTSDQWAAINSGATTTNIGQITTNKNAIGTLSNLNTTTKTDLVSSINEVEGVASTALQPNDNISSLTNDSGYITGITSGDVTTALGYTPVDPSNLATVATSGDYDDLINKPTIPAAQVNSDWNASSGVAEILNKPTLGTMAAENASEYTKTSGLATVATSGSYNDLTNKPTIPTVNNATLTIQKNGTTIQTFTANQSTNATANITVPTQASDINAANTSLSNLSSDGQMIIDSQNGTISNCILEIPQNIKLTLENNVLTLKSGSVLTLTGSTYATVTTTADQTHTVPNTLDDGRYYIMSSNGGFWVPNAEAEYSISNDYTTSRGVASGSSLPVSAARHSLFYNTTDKKIYMYSINTSSWADRTTSNSACYPLCIIEMNSGVASFAKDSNGNDMIFNGAGFIGHHAFVYPGVKGLIPDGLNDDGSLKSNVFNNSSLQIIELRNPSYSTNWYYPIQLNAGGAINRPAYRSVKTKDELLGQGALIQYVESDNMCYIWNDSTSSYNTQNWCPFVDYNYDGTTVTDFTIRQPVRLATTEMLDKKQDTITLTAHRAVVSDANGKLSTNGITDDELYYLHNATSNIQTQINSKQDTATAVNYDNISNCITEIPQDIKLELNNGTLALKAGSKVYVPNGSGVFDVVNIASDKTKTETSNGTFFLLLNPSDGYLNRGNISSATSSATEPSNPTIADLWYDTTNNILKRYSAGVWSSMSFPLCIFTVSNGAISSIDQVFNGFGYIGFTGFALPGIKGLIPNGRNEDGSLKSIEFTLDGVRTKTEAGIRNATAIWMLRTQTTQEFVNLGNRIYDETTNYIYSAGGTRYTDRMMCATVIFSNGVITSFTPKTPFHAVDYNDFAPVKSQVDTNTTALTTKANDADVVKLTGDQTVGGTKTFTSDINQTKTAVGYAGFYSQNTAITKGTAPSSNTGLVIGLQDSTGLGSSARLGAFQMQYNSNGIMQTSMIANKPVSGGGSARINLYYPPNGDPYTSCPTPTEDTTNSTQIDTVGARNTKINSVLGDIETILASI